MKICLRSSIVVGTALAATLATPQAHAEEEKMLNI